MKTLIHKVATRPSCEIYMEDGVLHGEGHYLVRSLYGEKWIKTPWTIDIHGPAEVSYYDNCSSFILLTPKIHFYWIIPAMFFLISMLLFVPYLRYQKLKRDLKACGITFKWRCCKLITKGPSGSKKISIFRMVLFLFCLSTYTVQGCIPKDRFIGNNTMFSAQVYPNEKICTISGDLILNNKLFAVTLNELYTSYDWEFKRESDWACGGVGASCPEVEKCESLNDNVTYQHGNIYKQFCKNYQKGCLGKRGCKLGRDIIYLDRSYKMYSLDGVKDKLQINKFQNEHCSVILASNPIVNFHNNRVVNYLGNWFLCNDVSNKGHPVLGSLGSVQSINGKFSVDWNGFKCNEDWFGEDNCKYKKHGLIEEVCVPLPNNVNGINYYIHNDELFFSTDSQVLTIIGSCKSKLIHSKSECYDVEVEIYGHRYSEYGLFVRTRAKSKTLSELGEVKINCTNEHTFQFVCNDKYHNFPISSLETCDGIKDESTRQGFTYNEMSFDANNLITNLNLHSTTHALSVFIVLLILTLFIILLVKCLFKCLS